MGNASKKLSIFKEDAENILRMSQTPKTFTRSLQRIVNGLGFSHFDITSVGPSVDGVLSSMPASLIDTYFSEGFDADDLSNRYVVESSSPVFYSDLFRYFLDCPVNTVPEIKRSLLVYELMKSYKFYDSYCSLLSDCTENKTIFTLQSKGMHSDEFRRQIGGSSAEIKILTDTVGHLFPQLYCMQDGGQQVNRGLTANQLAILEVMAKKAMTQQQAADYIGLTESTVKTYCKYIKQKLGQPTLMGAFYEAMRLGIITVD